MSVDCYNMPIEDSKIIRAIEASPKLGSLRRINQTFQNLASADGDLTGQVAEVIRRDPSLTSRLLKIVNSVFYGFATKIDNIEDAVFYLGTKQIRQMAMATPVLEDMQQFGGEGIKLDWTFFWQQCIGCAIMTREILSFTDHPAHGDSDYISGLIYGIGNIIALSAFPEEMRDILVQRPQTEEQLVDLQQQVIGWDHCKIAGHYLKHNKISDDISIPIAKQNEPELAGEEQHIPTLALNLAKRMIGQLDKPGKAIRVMPPPADSDWEQAPELRFLFDPESTRSALSIASLKYSLNQLPDMLKSFLD